MIERAAADFAAVLEELKASREDRGSADERMSQLAQSLVDARNALERERFRYHELFELAPDGYIVTDRDGMIHEANLAALQMLHVTPHVLAGKPLVSFVAADDRPAFRSRLVRVSETAHSSWDTVIQPRSGEPVPVNLTVAASQSHIEGDGTLRWLLRDISQRRRSEAALFESTQLLHALVQASPVAIAILNEANQVKLWNPAAERILGWSAAEVLGKIPPGIPSEVRGNFDAGGRTLSAAGRKGVETTIMAKGDEPVEVEIWAAPIVGADGETKATVAVATEISERKLAEQERRTLMQRIVNAQEEERARLSREMHDHLGQHLTAIMLGLKSLQADGQALPAGERRRASEEKRLQLQNMVEQLMQTTHRLAWELRPPELDDIGLEAALHRYAQTWGQSAGMHIDFQSAGYCRGRLAPEVETTLYRVAQEALTNVVRHAEAHSVSMVLKCDHAECAVIIEDDGRGFALRKQTDTTGRLGLTGMRERMGLVQGTLEIESEPGAGTSLFARVSFKT